MSRFKIPKNPKPFPRVALRVSKSGYLRIGVDFLGNRMGVQYSLLFIGNPKNG